MYRFILSVSIVIVNVGDAVASQNSDIQFNRIALTGDLAPGAGSAAFFEFPFSSQPSSVGDFTFRASLQISEPGVDSSNDTGYWSYEGGALGLIAREGSEAPGTGGAVYESITSGKSTESGSIGFLGTLRVGSNGVNTLNDRGIWLKDGEDAALIARKGGSAPGTGEAKFDLLTAPLISSDGTVTYFSSLRVGDNGVDSTNDFGIWSYRDGVHGLVAREGSVAPGTAGAIFDTLGFATVNPSGDVAFTSTLLTGTNGVDATNNGGVWMRTDGVVDLVVRKGQAAPGVNGAVFGTFVTPDINAVGDVVFTGAMQEGQGGVTTSNNHGIWARQDGTLRLVAREGNDAPGTFGADFGAFNRPVVNASGDIAFSGFLQNENNVFSFNDGGIWATRNGVLQLIAREDRDAPGTGGADFNIFGAPSLNALGDLSFSASLQTGENGVDSSNNSGIWAYSSFDDEFKLIVRKGDLFDISQDPMISDFRTISGILGSSLSDTGLLVFRLEFSDGIQGVFSTSVPSPSSATALIASVGALTLRRRR